MYKIENYYNDQISICADCLNEISNSDLNERFSVAITSIIDIANAYKDKAERKMLYEHVANNSVNNITGEELVSIYTNHLVPRASLARRHYDKIMLSTNNMICPYCGVRTVTTLDHYLPKKKYPDLSILAINLIPCCKDCNYNKRGAILVDVLHAYLHPYFEEIGVSEWLCVEIHETDPITINYYINQELINDSVLYNRLLNEFNELQLFKLYQVYAVNEISEMINYFTSLKMKQGTLVLSQYLVEIAESIKLQKKHWRYSLYKSLCKNRWFLEEYVKC